MATKGPGDLGSKAADAVSAARSAISNVPEGQNSETPVLKGLTGKACTTANIPGITGADLAAFIGRQAAAATRDVTAQLQATGRGTGVGGVGG